MEENKNVGKRLCLEDVGRNIRMNRVVGLSLRSHRHKNLGPNSQLGVHGSTASERILQIHTDIGVVGWGFFRAESESAASLLGRNPVELLCDQSHGLGPATMPLWDLVGKLLSKPVYELLGNRGCSRVPVYDSSIYFADLMPEYAKDYRDWFKKEVDMGLEMGHRAFKVKIGRGAKWMPQEEGNARDREILEIIRRHAGPDILIGADANNAYDPYHCRQLLGDLAELKLAFVEEMFPESVEECLSLKGFIAQNRWNTLVADGESAKTLDELRPLIESKALDVFQGDMRRLGIEAIMEESECVGQVGGMIAPHNFGSLLGFCMALHIGRAVPNFYLAEHDPLSSRAIAKSDYTIQDGCAAVPDAPGFGLHLDMTQSDCLDVLFDMSV